MTHAQFMALEGLPVFYPMVCFYMHLPPSAAQSVINIGNKMKVCLFSSMQFATSI